MFMQELRALNLRIRHNVVRIWMPSWPKTHAPLNENFRSPKAR